MILKGGAGRPFILNMSNAVAIETSTQTMSQLLAAGLLTELAHMTPDAQAEARALEAELLADAAAGVDLRIRLIGRAASA